MSRSSSFAIVLALLAGAVLIPREAEAGSSSSRSSKIRAFSALTSDATNASFSSVAFSAGEPDGRARVTVVLTRAAAPPGCENVSRPPSCDDVHPPVEVRYRTLGDSATPGSDYTEITGGVLRWARNEEGPKVFGVEILDDNVVEEDERVLLRLTSGALTEGKGDVTLGDPSDLTIVDDESERITSGDATVVVISGNGQTGRVNNTLPAPLVVEVGNGDGPIANVPVAWRVTRGDARLSDTATRTDAEGRAATRVTFGPAPGPVEVTASVEGLEPAVFTLTSQLTSEPDPDPDSIGGVLERICQAENRSNITPELAAVCDEYGSLSGVRQAEARQEMSTEEAAVEGTASVNIQTAQLRSIFKRLAALRGGAARVSAEMIAFNLDGIELTGEAFAGLWSSEKPSELELDRLLARARGGAASADEPSAPAAADDASDLGGRLGFFCSAVAGAGDQPQTAREAGFDFDTLGITAGLDYRFTDRFVFGGALGYVSTDADLEDDRSEGSGGGLDTDGYSLSAYATYFKGRYYLDGTLSYGRTEFELARAVDFPGRSRRIARGDPDGDQIALSLGGGYDHEIKSATVGGFGRLSYIEANLDAYVERGAGAFNLRVEEQKVESLLAGVGVEVSWAVSRDWGALLPSFRLELRHELEDSARAIRASFVGDLQSHLFAIPTDDPDRDYFNAGVGLSAVFAGGKSAFVAYEQDFARDDLDLYLVSAGFRLEL